MSRRSLRYGYTTGACAAAAAKGAALMLREQRSISAVEITLPFGEQVRFQLQGQEFSVASASCFVVKDAGDDPDITNGAAIHARLELAPGKGEPAVIISGGRGIGRVTKPGLAIPPGEWAINPVPRQMIETAIAEVFPVPRSPFPIHVTISIPDGEERARKTLNERLGIIGGLSILGTSGIVRPVSAQAWTDTIDSAISVALACGSDRVVLATGRSSELAAQRYFGNRELGTGNWELGTGKRELGRGNWEQLKDEAFVMMGDFFGHSLRACASKGVRQVIIAGQFAKLLKIACGHQQTHVNSSQLDLQMLAGWLAADQRTAALATSAGAANTARQVLLASGYDPLLLEMICQRVRQGAKNISTRPEIKVLLAGYHGEVLYFG